MSTHYKDIGVNGQIVWRAKNPVQTSVSKTDLQASDTPKQRILSKLPADLQARANDLASDLTDKIKNNETSEYIYDHLNGMPGQWTYERSLMHREIILEMMQEHEHVPTDRKSIIAGGLGGSGKTTTLRSEAAGINQDEYISINPDDIKEKMIQKGMGVELEGYTPIEAAALVHEESSHIAALVASQAYAMGKNVIWDITMSSSASVERRVTDMKEHGYNVDLVFVDITAEDSANRAMERWKRGLDKYEEGEGLGGRYVPIEIILKSETAEGRTLNREAFDSLALTGAVDGWSLFTNDYGVSPQMIDSENWREPALV